MKFRQCTWEGCGREARSEQRGKDGTVWADLCVDHETQFDQAVAKSVPSMLAAWVKAQGGPKAAAKRFR